MDTVPLTELAFDSEFTCHSWQMDYNFSHTYGVKYPTLSVVRVLNGRKWKLEPVK